MLGPCPAVGALCCAWELEHLVLPSEARCKLLLFK